MNSLQVDTVIEPNVTIMVLSGSADVSGSEELDRKLTVLSAQRPKVLIFDLSQLKFISSLAIGSLLRFTRGLTQTGGQIGLGAVRGRRSRRGRGRPGTHAGHQPEE